VHKPFYASGFLYHPPSGQILLQKLPNGINTKLSMFRGKGLLNEDPKIVFQQAVEQALGMRISTSSIHPIYDYIHDQLGEQFIFYVEVKNKDMDKFSIKDKSEWVQLSKLSKLVMSEQTRHDIIIGERVIRSLYDKAHPPQNLKPH
jgi:hypothetical protein